MATIAALIVAACGQEQGPLSPDPGEHSLTLMSNGGCIPEVISTQQDSIETLLFTFTVPGSCLSETVEGVLRGFMDGSPFGVDFGPGNSDEGVTYWAEQDEDYLNLPSPQTLAKAGDSGVHQSFIWFDPPVRSIEFRYSRWTDSPAWWGGQLVPVSDSMPVYAGTNQFALYSLTLHANTNRAAGLVDTWDSAELTAPGDVISWLRFDGGLIWIDDLKITRAIGPGICPDRPWFRDSNFLNQLRDLWEKSNPIEPGGDYQNSKEHGGWIVQNGDSYELVEWTNVVANECKIDPPAVSSAPIGTVGAVHTHPLAAGQYSAGVCGTDPDGGPVETGHGPSSAGPGGGGDIPWTQHFGKPYYLIDRHGVTEVRPDGSYGPEHEGCVAG